MLHPFKFLLAIAIVTSVATLPTLSHAQGSSSASGATKSKASNDEFEENRRAHVQKSKENNANKGAN